MASLVKEEGKKGRRFYVQLSPNEHPKRPKIRLGKVTKREAENARLNIEQLIKSNMTGSAIPTATGNWLAGIPGPFRTKLEKIGLVEPQQAHDRYLVEEWVAYYIESRKDVKEQTKRKWRDTGNKLEAFSSGRYINELTMQDGKEFRAYLKGELGLAENSIRKSIGIARQFFKSAVDSGVISDNPFVGQSVTVCPNPSRFYFVTPELSREILDACPNTRWRLIFSLCRFGGLRCPSEVLSLRWDDVDFENKRMKVHSPKTEHHTGHSWREVPLFPELETALREAKAVAPPDAVFCVEYRGNSKNLRPQFQRILLRAGMEPWPKLFQNLRSTRETELIRLTKNIKAVSSWIGNSPDVALNHYAQVTEADQKEALRLSVLEIPEEKSGAHTVQNLVVSSGTELQFEKSGLPKPLQIAAKNKNAPNLTTQCIEGLVVPTGLEPVFSA